MSNRGIYLGNDIEIFIDEPVEVSAIERPYFVTSILADHAFDGSTLLPSVYTGSIPLRIGYQVYRFYYEMRVKRVVDALDVYSEAIKHIEYNSGLYDARL